MKKASLLFSITLSTIILISCNCKSNNGYSDVEKQNMTTIEQMWEAWNDRDYEKVESYYADDFIYYSPYGNPDGMNQEETKLAVEHLWSGNPNIQAEIMKLMGDGDTVTQLLIITGTNSGEFNGKAPTNNQFYFGVISVFMFEDGKIKYIYESADFYGFMKQLGAI